MYLLTKPFLFINCQYMRRFILATAKVFIHSFKFHNFCLDRFICYLEVPFAAAIPRIQESIFKSSLHQERCSIFSCRRLTITNHIFFILPYSRIVFPCMYRIFHYQCSSNSECFVCRCSIRCRISKLNHISTCM